MLFYSALTQRKIIRNNGQSATSASEGWVWLNDLSQTPTATSLPDTDEKSAHAVNKTLSPFEAIRPSDKTDSVNASVKKQKPIRPVYTIPLNATLTGATLMTPLVGRIPIDGHITEPYAFKLVLSANNLTANGYPMPGIHGAVMSGMASGDLLGRCARGDVKSITFIFNDGTLSTAESKNENSLGYLSSESGDPCIAGTLHSNALLFLGAQMSLAGAEGYANAITRSQYLTTVTDQGATLTSLVGAANKAALGQGGSAAAQAAQQWWNQRVKNSFDYIYVSNQDTKTRQARHVVVNITQTIPINYNPNGRRVDEAMQLSVLPQDMD